MLHYSLTLRAQPSLAPHALANKSCPYHDLATKSPCNLGTTCEVRGGGRWAGAGRLHDLEYHLVIISSGLTSVPEPHRLLFPVSSTRSHPQKIQKKNKCPCASRECIYRYHQRTTDTATDHCRQIRDDKIARWA